MPRTIASCVMSILTLLCARAIDATICVSNPGELRYIRGIVVAKSSETQLLPGATVSLTRAKFGATAIADEDGYFSFRSVGVGEYVLNASLEGYGSVSAPVTVRAHALVGRVLVVTLSEDVFDCGRVESVDWKRERELQDAGETVNPTTTPSSSARCTGR